MVGPVNTVLLSSDDLLASHHNKHPNICSVDVECAPKDLVSAWQDRLAMEKKLFRIVESKR